MFRAQQNAFDDVVGKLSIPAKDSGLELQKLWVAAYRMPSNYCAL